MAKTATINVVQSFVALPVADDFRAGNTQIGYDVDAVVNESASGFDAVSSVDGVHYRISGSGFHYTYDSFGDVDDITSGIVTSATLFDSTAGGNVIFTMTLNVGVDVTSLGRPYPVGHLIDAVVNSYSFVYNGFSGVDNFAGQAQDDVISGGGGADILSGGGGNDRIEGGPGGDTLDGGTGSNRLSYAADTVGVIVDLTGNTAGGVGSHADGDTIVNFQKVSGGSGGDMIWGNGQANVLTGNGGADWLYGLAGSDTLQGGDGSDALLGGPGNDVLDGGAGTDTASYADMVTAVTVNLALAGQQNTGGAGLDTLTGIENLTGGSGNDVLTGDGNANTIAGGDGDDTITGAAGNDVLYGHAGDDVLKGSNGGDVLDGGADDDILQGVTGADQLHGGTGRDTVSYALSTAAVTVVLGLAGELASNGGSVSGGDATGDTGDGFENILGSAFADQLTGNGLDNVIEGGAGADVLHGGGGADTVSYASSSAAVTVTLGLGGELNSNGGSVSGGNAAGDSGDGFENILGSAFNDVLTGNAGANVISGGAGNDRIEGGIGADTLDGGTGNNRLRYAADTVGVTVNLSANTASGAGSQADGDTIVNFREVIGGSGGDHLTGNDQANLLCGRGGGDFLSGGVGNDTLQGDDGNDTLLGGLGNDVIDGGAGNDTVSYIDIATGVTVNLGLTTQQDTAGGGLDTLIGIENLIGGPGNDTLRGSDGGNAVAGGAGDDVIKASLGSDFLTGGADNDLFRFGSSAVGFDTITDFTVGEDQIGIVRSGFGIAAGVALGGTGANDFALHYFVSGTAATESGHGQFLFDAADHQLFWDADGTGSGTPTLVATFENGAAITPTDFLLI